MNENPIALDALPPRWRPRVEAELEPGETILWAESPAPLWFPPESIPAALFAIPWTAFALFWIHGAYHQELRNTGDPASARTFASSGIPFVLIGIGLLLSPLWARLRARKILYLITNRRALECRRGRTWRVRDYPPGAIVGITHTERRSGIDDLAFDIGLPVHFGKNDESPTQHYGFYRVRNAHQAYRLLMQQQAEVVGDDSEVGELPSEAPLSSSWTEPGPELGEEPDALTLRDVLPEDMASRIEDELDRGEAVLWAERPVPKYFGRGSRVAFILGIPFTALPLLIIAGALVSVREEGLWALATVPFILAFLLPGVFLLLSPVLHFRALQRMAYAITNRRVIVLRKGRQWNLRWFSLAKVADRRMEEHRDGTGSLIFLQIAGERDAARGMIPSTGFQYIPNPREADSVLTDLLARHSGGEASGKTGMQERTSPGSVSATARTGAAPGRQRPRGGYFPGKALMILALSLWAGFQIFEGSTKSYNEGATLTREAYLAQYEEYISELAAEAPTLTGTLLMAGSFVVFFYLVYEIGGRLLTWVIRWPRRFARRD